MSKDLNFLLVGVGGQGIILASDILADIGLKLGYDVKKSEVHGMSQRGGSVESHVRWGAKVYSPLSAEGEVDYLLSMEILETGRWASFVRPGSTVIVNTQQIAPLAVSTGQAEYPEKEIILNAFAPRTRNVYFVDGFGLGKSLGNAAVAGVILLGYLASQLDVDESAWLEVVAQRVPARFVDLNRQAFQVGRELGN
ncbi:MAG: indolepyruvate oxidoreductase subunit beta [Chloroflexi bacterium]|nr:indolepyruvate oxidoreductase subunit beta [Chloroflexota bacterium]